MASNRNSSPKDQGASEPNKKQSVDAEVTNVDWMIMSDLSTRIGGYPNPKPESKSSFSQVSSNQIDSDDLEDLAWLKSLDLDSPIERSPSQITSSSEPKLNSLDDDISEIDWLIVTDLKTRMDDSEIKAKASPLYQDIVQPNLSIQSSVFGNKLTDDILDDDLGLDGLEFLDNSDFSDLDSLGFDTSETHDLSISELLNEPDLSESDDDQDLDGFLSDNFDLIDNDWNKISEDISDQSNKQSNLDIISESFEIETQISQGFNPTEEYYEHIDPILDPLHNLEVIDEIQADGLIEDLSVVNNQLQDIFQDVFVSEEASNFSEGFDNDPDDGFGEVKSLESLNTNIGEDEFWSSQPIPNTEISANSNDGVFTDDWGQSNEIVVNDAINDLIWDASTNDAPDIISLISIDNTFGTSDDWAIAPLAKQSEIGDDDDWSAGLEDEINGDAEFAFESISENLVSDIETPDTDNVTWQDEIVEIVEEDWKTSEVETVRASEITNEGLRERYETELQEGSLDGSWDFTGNFDDQSLSNEDVQIYNDFNNGDFENISSNLDTVESSEYISEYIDDQEQINQQQFNNQFNDQFNDQSDLYNSQNNAQSFEGDDFEEVENVIAQSTEWENFSVSFAEPSTDIELDDDFVIRPLEANSDDHIVTDWDADVEPLIKNLDNLESIIGENFDLATFDEEYFPETSLSDIENENIATMLTSNPVASNPYLENEFASEFKSPSPSSDSSSVDELIALSDPFEEGLVNDLLNDVYSPVLIENTSTNTLLLPNNEYGFDVLDNLAPEIEIASTLDVVSSSDSIVNIKDVDIKDRDFLDDFDLDSISNQLTGDDFNSDIVLPLISTSLATPFPLSTPIPPVTEQEPTYSSINNPPPPPFLPPLPPKRNLGKAIAPPLPPSVPNIAFQSQPKNRNGEDDFDSFHISQNQNKNRKSINSIDEGWSELLDADTVLSGVLRSPTEPSFPNTSGANSSSAGRTSQGGRESNSSNTSKNTLPDFNDLGLEIHGESTDWSGLLDSGDLSDNITAISQQDAQNYSRARVSQTTSSRLDVTNNSETKEIPRDRRKPMASFGDATKARTSATPDQMDFNRFTEDNYNSYGYDDPLTTPATTSSPKVAFSQPKMTMPTINLESLWQNYLKIPSMGLGAIGGVFLLYSLLNRPVFDLGLRWGIFKDASGKDFTNADFKGAKLDNVDFSKAILTGAKMQDASLIGANFQGANLDGVNFTKANLNRARLIQASVIWAEFNNAQMNLVDLAEADLTRSNLANAKMEGVNLKGSKIGVQGTEKATKFSSTTLLAWQIVNESREGRNLVEQNLSGLNLSFTSLKRANLSNSKLNYTDMTSTDLSGANLTGSQVNGANWSGAKLAGINLTDVAFDKNKLPKTDEETVCPNGKKGPCKF